MKKVELKADVRNEFSKSAKTKLRNSGKVPGVFYSRTENAVSFAVQETAINPLVFTSEAHVIDLQLDNGIAHDCVLKDVQFDPVTDRVIHFDLLGLIKGEKIQIDLPLTYVGSPIGVREGGQLQVYVHKLHVECFPADIPEHLEVNVADLKMGHSIHVRDLSFENITILTLPETPIVGVAAPRGAEETTTADAAAPTEPEVIAKGKEKSAEE